MLIPITSIIEDDRIRTDYGSDSEWRDFKESFILFGQLQSIRVEELPEGNYKLLMGGRRLRALQELHAAKIVIRGIPEGMIEATLREPEPIWNRLRAEFAENMERKDFTFVEKARFITRFHTTMMEKSDGAWTQEMTAKMLNLSPASISHYLQIEEAVKKDETIANASTLDAAVKRMKVQKKLDERRAAVEKDSSAAVKKATDILHLGDAIKWIKTIPDNSVDFINFDPPWGDDVAHKSQENHEAFDDSTEYADKLMDCLFPHLFRVLKQDRFCAFWHRLWATEQMRARAESFGFNLTHTKTPCIWYKPDKVSDQNRDPERRLNEAYEAFYLLRKGDPVFHERQGNNVFAFSRVDNPIHPTEKSVDVCRAILRLVVVPGELVLDPTAGASPMLEAAVRFSCKALGCELSPRYYERGITRLAEALK